MKYFPILLLFFVHYISFSYNGTWELVDSSRYDPDGDGIPFQLTFEGN